MKNKNEETIIQMCTKYDLVITNTVFNIMTYASGRELNQVGSKDLSLATSLYEKQ